MVGNNGPNCQVISLHVFADDDAYARQVVPGLSPDLRMRAPQERELARLLIDAADDIDMRNRDDLADYQEFEKDYISPLLAQLDQLDDDEADA